MHKSNDENNFRNKLYIEEMNKNFILMFNAYHKYIAYRNKLLKELTMSDDDNLKLDIIDKKFRKNIKLAERRINKDDFTSRVSK